MMIRLNSGFRSDLAWWQSFINRWNGISFLPTPSQLPTLEMASDASGSWGCGAWHIDKWFQIQWDSCTAPLSITVKELIPIIIAGAVWGHAWSGHHVLCHCDNQVVVACLHSRTSKENDFMHLLRSLVFVEAHFNFLFYPQYINTHANHLATDLSCNNRSSFLLKVPQARPYPSSVPMQLLNLLLDTQADWTCQSWRHQFNNIFRVG